MIKYIVKVKQEIKYTETLVAEFDELEKATIFTELMFKSCKDISVEIIRKAEEEEIE